MFSGIRPFSTTTKRGGNSSRTFLRLSNLRWGCNINSDEPAFADRFCIAVVYIQGMSFWAELFREMYCIFLIGKEKTRWNKSTHAWKKKRSSQSAQMSHNFERKEFGFPNWWRSTIDIEQTIEAFSMVLTLRHTIVTLGTSQGERLTSMLRKVDSEGVEKLSTGGYEKTLAIATKLSAGFGIHSIPKTPLPCNRRGSMNTVYTHRTVTCPSYTSSFSPRRLWYH